MIPSITAPPPSSVLDKLNYKRPVKRDRPVKRHTVIKPGVNLNGVEYDSLTINTHPYTEWYGNQIPVILSGVHAGSVTFNNYSGNIDDFYYTYNNSGGITIA